MNIIDEMALEAIKDDYFLSLFHTAEKMYWQHILEPQKLSTCVFSSKEYADILTFADILSLSSVADHRNFAIKIISCLNHTYSTDAKFQYYSRGIMIRLGNFPGYDLLSSNDTEGNTILPLDISFEKQFKEIINKDQYSDKVFTDEQYYMLETLLDKNHFSFLDPLRLENPLF